MNNNQQTQINNNAGQNFASKVPAGAVARAGAAAPVKKDDTPKQLGRPKGTAKSDNRPDFNLVAFIEGASVEIGAMWSNADRPGKLAFVKIKAHKIPKDMTEVDAYMCPKKDKAAE